MVLRSLKKLLEPEFEVVAMADNALSLMDAVGALEPDLVVADLGIGSLDEGKWLRHLKRRYPEVRLVALGEDDDKTVSGEVLRWGVQGYVLKSSSATDLIPAVRAVVRGETYVSPACDTDDQQEFPQPEKKEL
jgi:two-component system response regulator NreC